MLSKPLAYSHSVDKRLIAILEKQLEIQQNELAIQKLKEEMRSLGV